MTVPDFHKEVFGDLTREEVETIIEFLQFCGRLQKNIALKTPDTEAETLADRLEGLLKKVQRREALYALEKGQCEGTYQRPCGVVPGEKIAVRCEGVAGHDGECPQRIKDD